MNELPKGSVLTISVIAGCAVLIGGISMWLGGDQAALSITSDTEEVSLEETLPAPLAAEALTAYNETMTNPNNPVATVVTNRGTIKLELFEDTMPITAGNFIKLAEEGFYDGTKFHRVIENFMIQGGDPNTKTGDEASYGRGGPGYAIADEHVPGEYLTNRRGTIAMANSGPNSGGSQFFINLVDNQFLDFDKEPLSSKHPVFGRVVGGMDVVDAIGTTDTNPRDLPLEPIVIESVEITRGS
jgi:peptidylprolyl isomerase